MYNTDPEILSLQKDMCANQFYPDSPVIPKDDGSLCHLLSLFQCFPVSRRLRDNAWPSISFSSPAFSKSIWRSVVCCPNSDSILPPTAVPVRCVSGTSMQNHVGTRARRRQRNDEQCVLHFNLHLNRRAGSQMLVCYCAKHCND